MRDIQFRGKRKDNGCWVYGNLIMIRGRAHINAVNRTGIVEPDTVGQYIGIKDKNGRKIYEGDLVRTVYNAKESVYQVVFDKSELDFKATNGKENYGGQFVYMCCCDEIEVVGNIYDTPKFTEDAK